MRRYRSHAQWIVMNSSTGCCECLRCGASTPLSSSCFTMKQLREELLKFKRAHTDCQADLSAGRHLYERTCPAARRAWDDLGEYVQLQYVRDARFRKNRRRRPPL